MGYYFDIIEFHTKFKLPPLDEDVFLRDVAEFRRKFLLEEMIEMQDAWLKGDAIKYLDALVDLDYVNLGTLYLVGIKEPVLARTERARVDPHLPDPMEFSLFVSMMSGALGRMFSEMRQLADRKRYVREWGQNLHGYIELHAHGLGFDFEEAWRRVQEANMQKVRAERAADSARGSTFDVVKPEGWKPPDLTDLCTPAQTQR